MMAGPSRLVEASVRVYEVLARAYPASFRERFGREMTHVFRELISDALRQRGTLGFVTVWLRVLGDLMRTALRERASDMRRRFEMKTAASALLSVALAAVVYLVGMCYTALVLWALGCFFAGGLVTGPPNQASQLAMVFLPAVLTGMVLARVKRVFRPVVTAPLGTMALFGQAALLDGGPPWWMRVGLVASVGFSTYLGYLLVEKLSKHLRAHSQPSAVTH